MLLVHQYNYTPTNPRCNHNTVTLKLTAFNKNNNIQHKYSYCKSYVDLHNFQLILTKNCAQIGMASSLHFSQNYNDGKQGRTLSRHVYMNDVLSKLREKGLG